jgi:hypothetical protein
MRFHNNDDPIQTAEEMTALVAAYRKSGLPLKRFAQDYKIPPGRLHYWVYQKQPRWRPRPLAQDRVTDRPPVFQEVKLAAGAALMESWAAEVRLAGGVCVRFHHTAGPDWIGRVVQALQRPC